MLTQLERVIETLDTLRGAKGVKSITVSTLLSDVSTRLPNHLGICDEICPADIMTLFEEVEGK